VALRLQFNVPTAELKAVGVRPQRGDFGLSDAAIIKPGDPHASTLLFRMAKHGRDRMPHIGSELPDEMGLQLVERWIAGLKPGSEASSGNDAPVQALLASPNSALATARRLARGEFSGDQKSAVLAAAAKLEAGNVRDLFEGFLPQEGERKLGSSPRPKTILAHQGDAGRGETLFWSEAVNCGKCHRVGERGTSVGPDLSGIGKLRTPQDLLESLLTPSRRVEPKYASYLAQTDDGQALTGVLVKRDERAVVLRDNQGKEVVLDAKSVQRMQPSRTSLMPDGQMAGLTAQQAADLLAYLATRRSEKTDASQ